MTIKEFFRKYVKDQTKLEELQYQLKKLDAPQVATTRMNPVKVQGGKGLKQDDKVIKFDQKREQLEYEIEMAQFEVMHAENVLKAIGDDGIYSVRYLKRRYLQCDSINKIAIDFGVSPGKVKKILKDTEDLMLCLIK